MEIKHVKNELLFKTNSWTFIAILIGLIIFLPISEVFVQLFNTSESWPHLKKTVFSTYLINTIILTIGTGLLSILIGVFCAWVVACCEFPLKKFFEWALILPLAIPTYVSAYAYFDILELSNPILIWVRENINLEAMQSLNSFFVYFFTILVLSSVLYPYVYLLTRASFLKQGNQLIEASLSLGHNMNEIFWKIALPMARPAVFAGLSLVIMETLNDYGAVKHFGIPTFTSGIFRTWLGMGDMSGALKLAAYLMLLILILLMIEKKARSRARYQENSGSNKPFKKIILSRKKSIVTIALCSIPFLFGFLIPVFRLSLWAFISQDAIRSISLLNLVKNSLFLSVAVSLVTVVLALLLVFSAKYFQSKLTSFTNRFAILGYSVPGAVIAMGILLLSAQINKIYVDIILTGSLLILIFAFITRFFAVAWQPIDSGMERNCKNINDASRSLGIPAIFSLIKVNIPLIKNTLITASILVFIDSMKELPLTLILRPFNFNTLSTATFDLSSQAQIVESSVPALCIIMIVAIPLISLNLKGKSKLQ